MQFPTLETIVKYGVYTVKELERFSKERQKRKITVLNECETCDFVYSGHSCDNCLGLITRPKADSKLL